MKLLGTVLVLLVFVVRGDALSIRPPVKSFTKALGRVGGKDLLLGSILVTTGDVISQHIDIRRSKVHADEKKFSPMRSLQWAVFGAFVNGMVWQYSLFLPRFFYF